MDYAGQVKIMPHGHDFTFYKYRQLKRKPPKVETKPETKPKTAWEWMDYAEQIESGTLGSALSAKHFPMPKGFLL